MSDETKKVYQTSIFPDTEVKGFRQEETPQIPTWSIIIFLCMVFFVLKKVIYLKDIKERQNK